MNEEEKKYHKSRKMFQLIDSKLVIAEPSFEGCHLDWLLNIGYSKEEAERIIDKEMRGVVDPDGNIKFFIGKGWDLNNKIELDFFKILPELIEKLDIKGDVKVGGGATKQEIGKIWPAKKDYGTVEELLSKIKNFVILVDDQDNELGVEEKIAAHENGGKRHRAFSILIFNDKNELMLQQRALNKYHCGGLWTNTCCSHPRPGEKTEAAAHRRLQEEMGFNCNILEKFSFNYTAPLDHDLTENEHDHVFVGYYNQEPIINKDEVESWKWISMEDLYKDVSKNPNNYTFWFKVILEEFKKH